MNLFFHARRQLYIQGQLALVPKQPDLQRFFIARGFHFFAQFPHATNALSIDAGYHVAGLDSSFARGGIADHAANQNSLTIWCTKVVAEIALQVFRIDTKPWLPEAGDPKCIQLP